MLRDKGGCSGDEHTTTNGRNLCWWGKGVNEYKQWSDQPNVEWDLGVAFSFVEM